MSFTRLPYAIDCDFGGHCRLVLPRLRTLTKLLFLVIQVGAQPADAFVITTRNLSHAMDRRVSPIDALKTVIGKLSFILTSMACLLCCYMRTHLAQSGINQSSV